jgi:NAD(P)-dependent dehydrogenase (short-subunit alcohol dehydrogenase family)
MASPSSSSFNHRVALVTGSSSGIGYETSLMLARNGFLTYATMRNLKKSENIKSLTEKEKLPLKVEQLDVTDDRSVKNAIQSITAESSKIDVLVNNAGYALNGALEDIAMEELKAQYETNLFGVTRVSSCPSVHEKTEIWNNSEYQFWCGTHGWFPWRIRLCWHKICHRRFEQFYEI